MKLPKFIKRLRRRFYPKCKAPVFVGRDAAIMAAFGDVRCSLRRGHAGPHAWLGGEGRVPMSRREVRFLWAGLVFGFLFGAVATVIGIAHIFGVPHAAHLVR